MGLKMREDGHTPSLVEVKLGNEQLLRASLGPQHRMVTCKEHGTQPRCIVLWYGLHVPVCGKCVMAYIAPEVAMYVGPSNTGH